MPCPEGALREWTWSLHDHVAALAHVLKEEESADTVIQCNSN